jgi:hypothetical protein
VWLYRLLLGIFANVFMCIWVSEVFVGGGICVQVRVYLCITGLVYESVNVVVHTRVST